MSNEHNCHLIFLIFYSLTFIVDDNEACKYHFYVGSRSNGTSVNSFLDGEKLATAQRNDTEFNLELKQTKACDLDWLVIGCDFNDMADKVAKVEFPESSSITCVGCGSSSLQNGLLTMVLTLSMSYFLMK